MSNINPQVSICIPTYNQTEYLRMTLDSVFSQRDVDFEVIVSDDSTTEVVSELIEEYEKVGKAIRYYRNRPGLGSPKNWNFAIQQAKGKFIKILHHDDRFTSETSLSQFVDMIDGDDKVVFAFSGTKASIHNIRSWEIQMDNLIFKKIKEDPSFVFRSNLIGAPSAVIFRKNSSIFFDENLKWLVDVEFYYRILISGKMINFCSETLVETFIPENRISNDCFNNPQIEIPENIYFIGKHRLNSYRNLNHFVEVSMRLKLNNLKEIQSYLIGQKINWRIKFLFYIKNSVFYRLYSRFLKSIQNVTSN